MATYKGKNTFAIIGAQDKDTLEDRRDELISKVSEMSQKNRGKIGYRYLFGRYEYENGELAEELSIMIIGITKEKAISICKELNQELIIWRDDNFFGFLDCNGNESGEFTTNEKNMSFSDEDIELQGLVVDLKISINPDDTKAIEDLCRFVANGYTGKYLKNRTKAQK